MEATEKEIIVAIESIVSLGRFVLQNDQDGIMRLEQALVRLKALEDQSVRAA